MKTMDEEVIAAFLTAKIKDLKTKAPGYISVSAGAAHHKSSSEPIIRFRAYCEHTGHSDYHDDVDAAIAQIASRVNGKSAPVLLREKAEDLLRQAKAIEEGME